jgi:hypothetical protein
MGERGVRDGPGRLGGAGGNGGLPAAGWQQRMAGMAGRAAVADWISGLTRKQGEPAGWSSVELAKTCFPTAGLKIEASG